MNIVAQAIGWYILSAFAEIGGCYAFWAWAKLGRSALWLIPGCLSLALFAYLLTRVDIAMAGRAYAVYGGIYIASALIWGWAVEGVRPDLRDMGGLTLCLAGTFVILSGRQSG